MIRKLIDFIKNYIKQIFEKRKARQAEKRKARQAKELREKMKKIDDDDPFSGMYSGLL